MSALLSPSACGVWVKIPAVEVVEILAQAGVGFIVLDREHGLIDERSMAAMTSVALGLGLPVFVRVAACVPEQVQPPLDAGADGLFVPHVDDAEAAARVVDMCRFPPLGHRHGSPTTRAGQWGRLQMAELVARGNHNVVLVAQIETPRAVQHIDEILAVEGLDAVLIGPFDLSLSSGLAAHEPEFESMVKRVEAATRGRRLLGGTANDSTAAKALFAQGYSFAMVGADVSLLAGAARPLTERGVA